MASSSNLPDASPVDLAYLYASNTNVSNFVSVKLSGECNYQLWKKQMLCLMKSHDMCGLVDDSKKIMNKYDSLLQGWIFGSVSEDVLRIVVDLDSAKDVWIKLKSCFDYPVSSEESEQANKEIEDKDSAPLEAKCQDAIQTETKDTNIETGDKNVVVAGKTTNVKGTNSVESEAKGEEATQIETEETETNDKVALKKQRDVILEIKEDVDSAESKAKLKTIDSAPTNVDKKIETKSENATTYTERNDENLANNLASEIMDGDWNAVYNILTKNKNAMTTKINDYGNTVLHMAVGMHLNDFIEELLPSIQYEHDFTKIKNSEGSTVLHIAAIAGNTNAAKLLVKEDERLLHISDNEGKTALYKAYENMHLDTIQYLLEAAEIHEKCIKDANVNGTKSSLRPPVEIGANLLVNVISAKQYDLASQLLSRNPEYVVSNDNVLMAMARTFPSGLDFEDRLIYPSLETTSRWFCNSAYNESFLENLQRSISIDVIRKPLKRRNQLKDVLFKGVQIVLCVLIVMFCINYILILFFLVMLYFTFSILYFLLWKVAARAVTFVKNIEQKKKEYEEAKQVLRLVCNTIQDRIDSSSRRVLYTGPILEAACQDAYEVVVEILRRWPAAFWCTDKNGYDIMQLATIHRSDNVYNLIYVMGERKSIYRTMEDSSKNNMLHLAARLAPLNKLKRRRGAALQLQREIQWCQEVQKLVFPSYVTKENILMETPEMVFTKEHENLVKEGEKWMKTVAESCSITAALITTIVFAAAITVPGGTTQDTGIPVFKKEIAFTIFALSDSISLLSSATALLVFLSILTARFAEEDFLVRLPRRLIIGLCSLLLSATAMMVAFSATLFLVFSDREVWMLAPLCVLALIPIAIFFILQAPLIVDLYRSTYISNFGKSKHNRSKLIRKRFCFGKVK